jgi:hypothetical protein
MGAFELSQVVKKDIFIVGSDDNVLSGKFFRPQSPNGSAVLYVHGYGADSRTCAQYARRVAAGGIAGLVFDLRGHGNSPGDKADLTINDHLSDVRQAYDYLTSPEIEVALDLDRIGIEGASYGGNLAARLAADANRPIKSLFLHAPALYPDDLQDQPRKAYAINNEDAICTTIDPNNAALVAIRNFTGKITLAISGHDSVVPPLITNAYSEAATDVESITLEGAQHALTFGDQIIFLSAIMEWAKKL